MISWILALSILAGQLVKSPLGGSRSGATLLDLALFSIVLFGLWKLKLKLKKPPLFVKGGLLFILVAILSLILSPLNLNFYEHLISFFYIIRFSLFILLGWIVYSGEFNDLKKYIYHVLIFSGIGLSLLGLLQFVFIPDLMFLQNSGWDPHYFRTVSTFLDPSFIGAYFVLTLILLTQNFVNIPQKIKILYFISVYLALLTTFSRGSYLMFAISFIVMSTLKRSLILSILTILLSLGLFLGYSGYKKGVAQPRNINKAQSAQFRLHSWERGLVVFANSPVLGVGYNAYRYALREYRLAPNELLSSKGGSSNDSSLLQVLSTTGLIGLISFLLFLISLIWSEEKNILHKSEWIILVSAMLGLIVHSFFANSLFYPFLLLWIILATVRFSKS